MYFLMVPITSPNSIEKWVIFWKKLIFRNFHQIFLISLTLGSYLLHPNDFFIIKNIRVVSALQNDTSFTFLLLCKQSQLTVLCKTLQFEMNIADFWRNLIKGLYKPKLNIKTCFL